VTVKCCKRKWAFRAVNNLWRWHSVDEIMGEMKNKCRYLSIFFWKTRQPSHKISLTIFATRIFLSFLCDKKLWPSPQPSNIWPWGTWTTKVVGNKYKTHMDIQAESLLTTVWIMLARLFLMLLVNAYTSTWPSTLAWSSSESNAIYAPERPTPALTAMHSNY